MKKFIIASLLTFGLFANSFQADCQTDFDISIRGGLNLNNISQDFKESDWEYETKIRPGFHIGPVIDLDFSPQLGFQTGLLFTSKGFAVDLEDQDFDNGFYREEDFDIEVDGSSRSRYNYFEIPLNLVFKVDDLQFFAGPYLSFGVGGKSIMDYSLKVTAMGETIYEEEVDEEWDLKPVFGDVDYDDLDDDEEAFNALDFGLNFGLGYRVGPVMLNAGYSLGLGNITPGIDGSDFDPADMKMSNRVINVSASFYLPN